MTKLLLTFFLLNVVALAQGTFQNLDFESANVPVVPRGQFGDSVSVFKGLPGWHAGINDFTLDSIWHNNFTLGSPAVIIQGPDFFPDSILEGSYSVQLWAAFTLRPNSASIFQTGIVPADSKSIRFLAQGGAAPGQVGMFTVSLGSTLIPIVPLRVDPNYTIYGGDISQFAGQRQELKFTALPPERSINAWSFDDIVFTLLPIPEPSTTALALCALAGAAAFRRHRTR